MKIHGFWWIWIGATIGVIFGTFADNVLEMQKLSGFFIFLNALAFGLLAYTLDFRRRLKEHEKFMEEKPK